MLHPQVNDFQVERLVQAIGTALERAAIPDVTTPSEVLSALFTTLERTLYALHKLETPAQMEENRQAVATVLNDLLLTFGTRAN